MARAWLEFDQSKFEGKLASTLTLGVLLELRRPLGQHEKACFCRTNQH